ncbi:MAG TPA: GH92 family glycosyl hydrolase [Luteibaculaceae bacterium]|nr:GH92 family glycosyl hydrolase [Luteibaculaceae bacterium]
MKNAILVFVLWSGFLGHAQYAKWVNPFIGTGGHGHTYPGATVPFGMVQLSPDTRIDGSWDGCGGYHYSDSLIYGFSHTHLSGVGVSDYGDVMLMPSLRKQKMDPSGYAQSFSHADERAEAGYYAVQLEKAGIKAELTASTRVGFHRYSFPEQADPWIIIDLNHRDKLLEGEIRQINDTTLQGYRISDAWATKQVVYFTAVFNRKIVKSYLQSKSTPARYGSNRELWAQLRFKKGKGPLLVKVSLSSADAGGSAKNMIAEVPHWDFEAVRKQAWNQWEKELSRIAVSDPNEEKLRVFYTAWYHCLTQPNTYQDVDGRYRGRDGQIHQIEDGNHYTVFSLWDTFRGLHPLLTWLDPVRTADFIKTFNRQFTEAGRLPVWELAGNETDCMIGYHAVPVIADAMMKNLEGFNYQLAYRAARNSAMLNHLGLEAYKKKGYIEVEDEHESVSKTLEYAYDDWCIAQMAGLLGQKDDYEYFTKRSYNWVHMFDARTQHMRPRSNGGWLSPFDPYRVDNHYTEANSWQYSFFVPHHVPEFVKAHGGINRFASKLDELFSTTSSTTGREQSDITGLIGQYAHGNEPSHHMAYFYSLIGQPHKGQRHIRRIMDQFYQNSPDGLIGNEDCGQMSAWLVWSALGMYPFCPGKSYYTLGTPWFERAEVKLPNEKTLVITAKGVTDSSTYYVSSASVNGTVLSNPTIQYADLMRGGELAFDMSSTPASKWNLDDSQAVEMEWNFRPAPIISADKQVFRDSMLVNVKANYPVDLWVNQIKVDSGKMVYAHWIRQNAEIMAYAADTSLHLDTAKGQFFKIPNRWKVSIEGHYNNQYTAGGDEGLLDGLRGDVNWRKGRWQGYQDQDVLFTLDLGEPTTADSIGVGLLQDTRAWILMPAAVTIEISSDGQSWQSIAQVPNPIAPEDYQVQTRELWATGSFQMRYVRYRVQKFGNLPKWHAGAGYPAFFFVDELLVR